MSDRRPGAPALPESDRRTRRPKLRLSPKEEARAEAAFADEGVSTAARRLLLAEADRILGPA